MNARHAYHVTLTNALCVVEDFFLLRDVSIFIREGGRAVISVFGDGHNFSHVSFVTILPVDNITQSVCILVSRN